MAPGNHNRRKHGAKNHPSEGGQHPEDGGSFHPTKMLYRIFQAIHHLIILRQAETDSEHPLFMKKVHELDTSFFKVAGAKNDPIFLADLKKGNREWRNYHIQSQIRHYERMINFERGSLSALNLTKLEMQECLFQAKSWARKSFRKKFNPTEFSEVEQIAHRCVTEARPAKPSKVEPTAEPQPTTSSKTQPDPKPTGRMQPTDTRSTPRVGRKRRASTPSQDGKRQKDSESPRSASLDRQSVPSAPKVVAWETPRTNSRKRRPEASPETSPTSTRDSKSRKGESSPVRNVSPVLRNHTSPKPLNLDVDFGFGNFGSRFRPLDTVDTEPNTDTPSGSKRKKDVIASPPASLTTPKRGRQEQAMNSESSPPLRPVRASAKENDASRTSPSHNKNVPFQNKVKNNKIPFKTSDKVKCFPKLEDNVKGKKITDRWYIPKIEKSKLVLGPSNFSRIENVDSDDVQIVSYEGMKFGHLQKMLDNFKFGPNSRNPGIKPTHVTIMVGINDMDRCKSTNKFDVSKIYTAAKTQFSESKISFCQVPMKRYVFTQTQCNTIDDLNEEIVKFCNRNSPTQPIQCIPTIPVGDFEVDPADPIHWTPSCADKTIKHILNHLN